jgi:hypothetical protein
VHLAAADDGQRAGADRRELAIEVVMAGARPDPDELVVVVAVGLADGLVGGAADVEAVEQPDFDEVGGAVEAVDREGAVGAGGAERVRRL